MEQYARLQARIASLGELRDLVRMMRGLASNHLQQALGALDGIQHYVRIVEAALATGGTLLPRDYVRRDMEELAANSSVLIVVASEHGFVGGFNDRLIEHAESLVSPGQKIGIIGRRASALAEEYGLAIDWSFPMATHVDGVLNITRRVADHMAGVVTAEIVYGRYIGTGSFEIGKRSILPLDPVLLETGENAPQPLHHLRPELLMEYLAKEYLFAEISRAVMESMASENGIRLRVMGSASDSIDSKIETLTRQEQMLRQQEITTELLDVVSGASAIMCDGKKSAGN